MAAFLTRALDLAAGTEVFADTARHHFEADIAALGTAGITRGCNPPDNTLFCPDDPVTRGQMAPFLTRPLDLAAGTEVFADTARHHFEADIAALAAAGITRGCNPPDNTLSCPDAPVTRAQMAALLSRALEPAAADADTAAMPGALPVADIAALATAGITRGCNPPDNTLFCPDDPVTRGQ